MGTIVEAEQDDSVLIEADDGGILQIPADLILAADRVFRYCQENVTDLDLYRCGENNDLGWNARIRSIRPGYGTTPWAALADLAKALEEPR